MSFQLWQALIIILRVLEAAVQRVGEEEEREREGTSGKYREREREGRGKKKR